MTRELWAGDGVPSLIHFMRASTQEGAVNQSKADYKHEARYMDIQSKDVLSG